MTIETTLEVRTARLLWTLYEHGEWIDVALLCREANAALWDVDGVSCDAKFREPQEART